MKKEFFKPEVEVIEIGMDVLTDTGSTSQIGFANGVSNPTLNPTPNAQSLPIIPNDYDVGTPDEEEGFGGPTDVYDFSTTP